MKRKRTEGRKEGYNRSTDWDGASLKMGRKWRVTEEDGVSCFLDKLKRGGWRMKELQLLHPSKKSMKHYVVFE